MPRDGAAMATWDVDYDEPAMRPLPHGPIVVVKGQMGVGKTKALSALCALRAGESVLLLTFSRALASKLAADFAGFADYQAAAGPIADARVVVCLDSLHRVTRPRYDVVILDEAVSVLLHFNSRLMARADRNADLLDAHAAACRSLYLVDAAVDLPFVRRIVEHFERAKSARAQWVRNRHVRSSNRVLELLAKPRGHAAHDAVLAAVRAGERVVVCSSTKKFVLELAERAAARCPRARVVAHYGGSDGDEPLKDVDARWSAADLLIYSPSVTAGVSFERAHFDRLFANFVCSPFTPGVEIALQQLFRARQLRGGRMTVWYTDYGRRDRAPAPLSVDDPRFRGLHPLARGGLDHRTPLGRLVAQGIVDMRHRSDTDYVRVLVGTLRRDHGIEASSS